MKQLLTITAILFCFSIAAQKKIPQVQILTKDIKTSLRGLSVVNDRVVWVSGSMARLADRVMVVKPGNGLW